MEKKDRIRVDTVPQCRRSVNLGTRDWRRSSGNSAVLSLLNRYLIYLQRTGSGSIKGNLRFCVGPFGGNFRRSRLGQVGLILDNEIIRRKSNVKSRLFHIYGLLLKNAALDRGLVSRPSLLHGDIRIGDFQAYLILELLATQLTLPDLQFVANGIRLSDAIPQG